MTKTYIFEDKRDAELLKTIQTQLLDNAKTISSINDNIIFQHKGYIWDWRALKPNWYRDKNGNSVYGFRTKIIIENAHNKTHYQTKDGHLIKLYKNH